MSASAGPSSAFVSLIDFASNLAKNASGSADWEISAMYTRCRLTTWRSRSIRYPSSLRATAISV
jgi:hypothetical protein